MDHPITRREIVTETLHGQTITDPYRWLEDETSPAVAQWTAEQNSFTRAALDRVAGRNYLRGRLAELLSIGTVTAPVVRGERHFYLRREGQQNQPVLLMRDGFAGSERVLLDPNAQTASGTVALDWWYPSEDGRLLAFGYSNHGDEWSTLQVLDVASGELLPERIERTRYASLAWEPDGTGFYYSRYPAPGTVPPGEEQYHSQIFYHRLGVDPATDPHIFGEGRAMTDIPIVSLSPDGRYLLINVHRGWTRNEVYVRDLAIDDGGFDTIISDTDAIFEGEIAAGTLYLRTNWRAPRYRIVAVDLANPDPAAWRDVVAEHPDTTIERSRLLAGKLVLHTLRDVASHAEVYDLDGGAVGEIAIAPLSSITGLGGESAGDSIFVAYESYVVPPTVTAWRPADGNVAATTWADVSMPVDLSNVTVAQVWYTSRDGTRVPMILFYPAGTQLDGNNPVALSGYGGFNLSKLPLFTRSALAWVEMGGVYAVANMRGGAEFGEDWHRAGMLGNKQNVFDDFIAAAEYLIEQGYTSPRRLGIHGRSNGGLLVGAALVQRPDLFGAVVCQVPLLDMLRYHHFRLAKLWVDEYGSADDPAQFAWLHAYSPYHNVDQGRSYPPVLFTTAWSDSRVDPLHARKMTALLQSVSTNPVLLFVEEEAGHGQGKPLAKYIDEQLDVWCFFAAQLGIPIGPRGADHE